MLDDRDYMRPDWARGGRGQAPTFQTLSLTTKIIGLCGIVFILQMLVPAVGDMIALSSWGLTQWRLWEPVTYMFGHGGFFHILFNMWALWIFGRSVEDVVGKHHYLAMFLGSGLLGAALWLLFNWNPAAGPVYGVIGASGAVMGMAAACAFLFPNRPFALLFPPIVMKTKTLVAFIFLMDVLMLYTSGDQSGVAHLAHIGGFGFGLWYIWEFQKQGMSGRRPRTVMALFRNLFFSGTPRPSGRPRRRPGPSSKAAYEPPDLSWAESPDESDDSEVSEKTVDEILDKISRSGMKSLTRRERQLLDRARQKMKDDS